MAAIIDSSGRLLTASPLSADQKDRLGHILTFLVNVAESPIAARAARHGYDEGVHEKLWGLYGQAAGQDRPFRHYLAQAEDHAVATADSATQAIYRDLDVFENKWFPRVRNALRAEVAPDRAAAVEEAFFADLQQQPEGPLVVGSVATFLSRHADLQQSQIPGVAEALALLKKQGLTQELLTQIGTLVERSRKQAKLPVPRNPVDPATIQQASEKQLAAYDKLNRLYITWAGVLRQELPHNDAVHLGILSPHPHHPRGTGGSGGSGGGSGGTSGTGQGGSSSGQG
jgi:hypothetical protein